jgi:hypothetical protein
MSPLALFRSLPFRERLGIVVGVPIVMAWCWAIVSLGIIAGGPK